MKKKFTLSDQQKEWIKKNGESLEYDVKDITVTITGDKSKDGRSIEGVAVKKFLSEDLNVKPKVRSVISSEYDAIELNVEQRKFLRLNFDKMTIAELTLSLYPDLDNSDLRKVAFSKEGSAVTRFLTKIGANVNKNTKEEKFEYPEDIASAITLINKYSGSNLKKHTLENFKEDIERERFLESFICDTWDKEDLTSGEISQYIDLAGERVHLDQIKKHQQELQEMLEVSMRNEDKIQYTLVESIDKQIQNRDKCMGRIEKLQKSLEGTRTQRLKEKSPDNVTILSIIEKFMKEKERKQILIMQKKKDEALADDIDKLDDMDEYVSKVLGITKSEIISQQ
jgi:hypothetical protein